MPDPSQPVPLTSEDESLQKARELLDSHHRPMFMPSHVARLIATIDALTAEKERLERALRYERCTGPGVRPCGHCFQCRGEG